MFRDGDKPSFTFNAVPQTPALPDLFSLSPTQVKVDIRFTSRHAPIMRSFISVKLIDWSRQGVVVE